MTQQDQDTAQIGEQIVEAITAVFGKASPSTVFSDPKQIGDDHVITAAAWERAGGFGLGAGYGTDQNENEGGGSGGGGGGYAQGRPVAIIRITPNGVDVKPVIDFTKIGVTLLLGLIGVWRALRN